MNIDNNGHIALLITMMQGQQPLTLHWGWFSKWGREHIARSISYEASECFIYDWLQPVAPRITQDTQPTIIDAHFQDGAGSAPELVFAINAARNAFMTVCNQFGV